MADDQMTVHAQHALDFTTLFGELFGGRAFGKPPHVLKLTEADALSTDGGRKARQSLVLAHQDSDDSIVCGFVDSAAKMAEIRTHAFVGQQFAARHGRELALGSSEYAAMVKELEGLLRLRGFQYRMIDVAPQRAPSVRKEAPPPKGSSGPLWLAVGILVGFGAGYLVFGSGLLR